MASRLDLIRNRTISAAGALALLWLAAGSAAAEGADNFCWVLPPAPPQASLLTRLAQTPGSTPRPPAAKAAELVSREAGPAGHSVPSPVQSAE